jgi:two-component system alkaline phosphatase synthesis response regulator PhoP
MSSWEIAEDEWPDAGTTGDVLIVDDDASIRAMLAFVFDDAGYRVIEAVDGRDALEVLRTEPPALMVLDLMMPDIDGVEVLRRRQGEGIAADTRILVLTAKVDTQDAVWCWELGADEYVTKPVDPDQLLRNGLALLARTPEELRHHRHIGLEEARRLDALEAAFTPKPSGRGGRPGSPPPP